MIIIVGGGIAGLSLGWQLAKRGAQVTLIEQNKLASGASHAAGSYLEARLGTGAMRELEWSAVKIWPRFAADVEEISGKSIDYHRDGQIRIAYEDTIDKVRADHDRRLDEGWNSQWLSGDDLRALEPHLSAQIVAGAYLPDINWCDGRKLCVALGKGIRVLGGRVQEDARISTLLNQNGRVSGVAMENGEEIFAEKVILCSGMGTENIERLPTDVPKPRPVKGVMLSLQMDPKAPLIKRLIKHPSGILCPRSDGRLLVGVTHSDGETSPDASKEDVSYLMDSAARAVPAVRKLPLTEAAVGIRSLVGDGTLRLGRSREVDGLYYSLSHAGAGFLRAPAISDEFCLICFV